MTDLGDKCKHEVVGVINLKDAGQSELLTGACYNCPDNVTITDEYRIVSGKVYELVPQVHHVELDGNRE